MILYGNKPQEKAMMTLIHDTNNGLSLLSVYIKRLELLNIKDQESIIEDLKGCKTYIRKSIDNYYTKFKDDFKDEQNNISSEAV